MQSIGPQTNYYNGISKLNKVVLYTLAVRQTLNKEHLVITSRLLLKLQAPLVCKVLVPDQYHGEDEN